MRTLETFAKARSARRYQRDVECSCGRTGACAAPAAAARRG